MKSLFKVPYFEATEDRANIVLIINGLHELLEFIGFLTDAAELKACGVTGFDPLIHTKLAKS